MAENTAPKAASTIGLKDFVIAPLTEDTVESLTYGADNGFNRECF